jgi:hypothetical protein
MAGLIDKNAAPEQEPPEGSPTDLKEDVAEGAPEGMPANDAEDAQEGQDGALSPENVAGKIKMPPELQNAYERVVLAGMKVMFDKSSHESALQQLQGPGPVAERLGKAIAGLMVLLFKQSNQTMPPQVIIPAGTDLLVRAADFLKKSGKEQVTDQDIGEGLSVMIETLLTKFGLDPAKVLNSYDGSNIPEQGGGLVDQAAGAAPPITDAENPAEETAPDEEKD